MSSSPVSSRSKTCALTVKLPESVVGLLGPTSQEAAVRLKRLALIELFREGELSGGKAAELLDLSRAQWLDLLASHGVPHTVVTEESLEHDLKALEQLSRPQTKSSPTPDH